MSGLEQAPREVLLALVAAQAQAIEELTATVQRQAARIAELERRLGQNSGNSSLPPSSDRFTKASRPARGKSGRRPGKQPGAPGAGLELVADPDEVVDHVPAVCAGCGAGLADATEMGVVRRQVRDIPKVSARTVKHRMHKRRCGCGCVTTAAAPDGVDAPVSYGPHLRALAVYLLVFQHIPVERTAQLIADFTGATPSTGWVSGVLAEVGEALADVDKLIRTLIAATYVIGVDETSMNINGVKQWLHVARTELLTAYHLHPSRGRAAVDEFGILPAFTGVTVRDALSVYDAYPALTALCGSHLVRELTAAAEANPGQVWPVQARHALAKLGQAANAARDEGLDHIPPERSKQYLYWFDQAVLVGLAEHPRAPGRKQTKTRNLLERLRDRHDDVLRFTTDLRIPFTNNGSERDLRPIKTQLKISGCHRSATGARAWLRLRGYISTARKNGLDVMTALYDAVTGNPWTPPVPAT